MIVDVNVLVYATQHEVPQHAACRSWLEAAFMGDVRIGLPWATQLGFVRISTHPRIINSPASGSDAWGYLDAWLDEPLTWVPTETPQHGRIMRELTARHSLSGNLIPDAHLVALAIGHGLPVVSCDSDFARFTEVEWVNPSRYA